MRKRLSIILISLLAGFATVAQDLQFVKAHADRQFANQQFDSALKEYQRVQLFDTDNQFQDIFPNIAAIYYERSEFDEAAKYFDLAYKTAGNDSLRFEMGLKKALCSLKQEAYFAALYELLDLPEPNSENLRQKKDLYLGICHFGLNDYETAREHIVAVADSADMQDLEMVFNDFDHFRKKYNPRKVSTMSKILPGLGQVYVGKTGSGINSFVLVGGVVGYAVHTAMSYGILDGVLVLSSWFNRYYSGGFHNAEDFAVARIEQQKTAVYGEILDILESK